MEKTMKQIWKYLLGLERFQVISIKENATILTAQAQRGQLCLWAMVDASSPDLDRWIEIVPTGSPTDADPIAYIGTVQIGMFVWHVFTTSPPNA